MGQQIHGVIEAGIQAASEVAQGGGFDVEDAAGEIETGRTHRTFQST
jgi:hypothetical protein